MNETYLIMAKTVEEAIAIANREYARDGKEVSYEILEMPKKGFLGIGARDAKIKITVTESESSKIGSELNSIVADLRGMKVHTNRGGSGNDSDEKSKKHGQTQGQKKPQNNGQGQKKPAEKSDRGQANAQNTPKQVKPQQNPNQTKPAEPKKPQEPRQPKESKNFSEPKNSSEPKPQNSAPKSAEPKQDKPQRPVEPKKPQEAKEPKQGSRQPGPERQPREPKNLSEPKPAEKPAKPQETPAPVQAKPEPAAVEPVKAPAAEPVPEMVMEPAAEPAKPEYKSSLRNQAKPQRRQNRPKSQNADAVPGAEAIIASPVGLADFTREENGESFGSVSASSGRMSNDIRKKPRLPKSSSEPKREAAAAEAPVPVAEIPAEETPVVSAEMTEELTEVLASAEEAVLDAVEDMEPAEEVPVVEEDRQKVGVTETEMQYALDFTNTLLKNMAIGATASRAECPEGEEYVIEGDANVYPKINIHGDGTGILIGHHGETLDAVQYLVNLAALRQSKQKGGDYVKIVVDIENYRAKREETLRSLARRMAARAVKYKRNVFLEPMNAYERRIIHSELHSFENVSTHSVGADKNRKIIITYEGPDKVQQPRRGREPRENREDRADRSGAKSESRGSASRRGESRRPKKIQKMPIEKLPDFLAAGTTPDDDTFIEIED